MSNSGNWIKTGWIFLFIFVAADFVSISVAQMGAFGMAVCWIGEWISSGQRPEMSRIRWPLAAFVVASLISALFSLDMAESIRDSKDLTQIIIFFAAYDLFQRNLAKTDIALKLIAITGGLIALVGVAQVAMEGLHIHQRITGFQDIWMTYAGLLMLGITLSFGVILFSFKKWRDLWLVAAVGLMVVAVVLSLTRNAWLGALAGMSVIAILRRPVSLAVIPVLALIVFALSPSGVQNRITSIVDIQDNTNRERLLLWSAGAKIWADYPVFGVGQNSFPLVYPKYRDPDVLEPEISHLHNNFLELAVERGLIGLVAWMSIWITALLAMAKAWRQPGNEPVVQMALAASIGSLVAFLVAGIFEYNFGDSEMQMLFYFILALGMAAAKQSDAVPEVEK